MMENSDINRENIFNFPQASNGFHYRGQSAKLDEATGNFSQLCCFMSPDQDKLSREIKYRHMYSIVEDGKEIVAAKCFLCPGLSIKSNLHKLSYYKNSDQIDLSNYWKHAFSSHLSEFSEKDIENF